MSRQEDQVTEHLAAAFMKVCEAHFSTHGGIDKFINDLDEELGVATISVDELLNALLRILESK